MIKTINYLFVTCFGIGSIRFAPGTITSLLTTIFLFSLFHIINLSNNTILLVLLIVLMTTLYLNIKDNENKDPKEVVVDEFIGQSIQFFYMKSLMELQKISPEAVLFYLYISFYLGILISKNLFQSVFLIRNLKIVWSNGRRNCWFICSSHINYFYDN